MDNNWTTTTYNEQNDDDVAVQLPLHLGLELREQMKLKSPKI